MLFDEDPQVEDVIVYSAVTTDDVSAVIIKTCVDGLDYRAEGSAKRHPKDIPNRSLGITLAAARAFRSLSDQLLQEANLQLDDPGYDFSFPVIGPAWSAREFTKMFHSLPVTEDGSVT